MSGTIEDVPDWLVSILDEFEGIEFFQPSDVERAVRTWLSEHEIQPESLDKPTRAELHAFQFRPNRDGELSSWKTHFGPIWKSGDQSAPDIALIDHEIMGYWKERISQARHPILRARYADLVWDLTKVVCNDRPTIESARVAIDSYIASSLLACDKTAFAAADWLQRALQLALSINDESRTIQTCDSFLDLATRVNQIWIWVFLYDTLEKQTKVTLSNSQKEMIERAFEDYISTAEKSPQSEDPSRILHVAGRLVRHYQRMENQSEADRVVLKSGHIVEQIAKGEDPLKAHYLLDHVYKFYRTNTLKTEAERVQIDARKLMEQAESNSKGIPIDLDIDPGELEVFAKEITEAGIDAALGNITWHFVRDPDEIRSRLTLLQNEFPLAMMIPTVKMGQGQVIGSIGSPENDPNGSLVKGISDDISFTMVFLAKAFDTAWERYNATPDDVTEFLFKSPVFSVRFQGIARRGVEAYFAKDHLKAIHLLVPQIENALRFLLQLAGRPPNKPRRGNDSTMSEKTLTDILEREPVIREILGDLAHLYLLTFLTDPRGFNIRNRMSHGLMAVEDFHRGISDRVLHILLVLGTIRETQNDENFVNSSDK